MMKVLANILLTLILVAGCVAGLFFFNRAAAPMEKVLAVEGAGEPDYEAVLARVTPDSLTRDLEALCATDSRFTGSPGAEQAADYIRDELRELGYRLIDQPFHVTVPATRHANITDADGNAFPGIDLAPIIPNWFRTATTPPQGVTGTVLLGDRGLAREFIGKPVKGSIVMLPIGVSWSTVASMGAGAVLYYDDGKQKAGANWQHHADASLNLPRFLIRGDDPLALVGQTVTIRARVDLERRLVHNIMAVLQVPEANEAVVFSAYYDSYSYTPDLAPGAAQAASPTALLAVARELATAGPDLKRTVVILATAGHAQGLAGIREFSAALGQADRRDDAFAKAEEEDAAAAARLTTVKRAAAIANDPSYWAIQTLEDAKAYWAEIEDPARKTFKEITEYVLERDLMAAYDATAMARVDWIRQGLPVKTEDGRVAPSFVDYDDARAAQQLTQGMLSTPFDELRMNQPELVTEGNLAERLREVAARWVANSRQRQEIAAGRLAVADQLLPYDRIMFLGLDLSPRVGRLALIAGDPAWTNYCMPADNEVFIQLQTAAARLQDAYEPDSEADDDEFFFTEVSTVKRLVNLVRALDVRDLSFVQMWHGAPLYFESPAMLWGGYTAFTITTPGDGRATFGTPFDELAPLLEKPADRDVPAPINSLCTAVQILTAAASQTARGQSRIVPVSISGELYHLKGQVVSQVGENLTPDQEMPGAIVRLGPAHGSTLILPPGGSKDIYVTADENGEFEFRGLWYPAFTNGYDRLVNFDAAILNPQDGAILWTLSEQDSGPKQPYTVRSEPIAKMAKALVTPVLFRCAAVQVVPMSDPATFKPYAGFSFVEARTLAPPEQSKVETSGGSYVCFVPPESSLYFTFKKGSIKNPNLTQVRGFALNAAGPADGSHLEGLPEVYGQGYFAADTPQVVNIELDAALSMAQVNARRLQLQEAYDMADDMTRGYSKTSMALATRANDLAAEGDIVEARKLAAESVAYSSNIHPVIRKNASDAIWGIIFYLLLAVPFAICMEKLLFGSPDIRWQIGIQGGIFMLFFFALRAVHPAYQLVRSPYMILLGFITFTLAAMVGTFVAARFSQNIRELQKKLQGQVEAADVSRAGAAMAAFVLGLGHMRKRKVRTSLTVGTLILTTFVMLCFASVTSNVRDVQFAVGEAGYTGLFVRDRQLATVAASLSPLRELYGADHVVAPRNWGGTFVTQKGIAPERAEYTVLHEAETRTYEAIAHAYLGLSANETAITPVTETFDCLLRWFERDQEYSCMLPREVADSLRVSEKAVTEGTASVTIGSQVYQVLGIFDAEAFAAILDLDGQSLVPLDVLGLIGPNGAAVADDSATDIPEDVRRLPADTIIITPCEAMPANSATASIAVALQDLDYAEARELIMSHLERTAEPAYFGLDNIAFYGGKFRTRSVAGLLELILPIIVAALTVLNTMRGSVYERKSELYVFNAVGLSPSHIWALFIAEACVYAVVGAVGGYLLAQGIGAGTRLLGLTAGLSMNYSSLTSVVVSLVIMTVVFLSSIFPARMAARLAAPAETMTRERRISEGDIMEFDLPFTFNRRDRVAIIPYFADWFENYGEGSSGEFFCDPPTGGVLTEDHGGVAPFIVTTTWLKPYDLGVSQEVEVIVRHEPDSGDNIATVRMTRKSGNREAWERCCHSFIGLLRKRFLTWRAIDDASRNQLFDRGRDMVAPGSAAAATPAIDPAAGELATS